ncbi:MAG: DUF4332 domain-containing protein [Methanosarcinaceae archaeon]|nr:DUF4332 domain-containing protein [Methanosarcinaceae archaeon]
MTLIVNLKSNLEDLRIEKNIDEDSLINLRKNLDNLDIELQNKDIQIANLTNNVNTIISEKVVVELEKKVMSDKIAALLSEKAELEANVQTLQLQRPQIHSTNLVTTFRQSLDSMASSLNTPDARGNYTISNMNVKLKTNLSLKDNELQFQFPKPDDIILPENLSTIEFTIRSSPNELDVSEYMEVPDLKGMTQEDAEGAIKDAGFKPGIFTEVESSSSQGTVISQMPSANSIAMSGDLIDITISKIVYVEVPKIVDFDIDSAKEILASSNLEVGRITAKQSASTPGMVIHQSIESGTHTLIGTSVDIVVAEKMEEDKDVQDKDEHDEDEYIDLEPLIPELIVPDVVGMDVNKAKSILESEDFKVGRIIERSSTLDKGIVIGQNPVANTEVKTGVSVDLTVANSDIEMIEGIGPERGSRLRKGGIYTISDLVAADSKDVSELVGKTAGARFISMANLIDNTSTLSSFGIDRQSAEILVKTGGINSPEMLKNANPDELYSICKEAVKSGKVEVPIDYTLKIDDVKRWIEQAQ